MARDVNRIMSKTKWTGEELGRILLAELVRTVLVAKGESADKNPLVTDKDLTAMEKGLETDRNYNVYNTYRYLYFQVTKNYNQGVNLMSQFQGAYNREIMHLSDCYNHEKTKLEQSKLPIIVTKSKYEELTKEAREELNNIGESYAGLIIKLAGWFSKNLDKAPAGFAEALEATKQEQVTNKEIAEAWLNEIDGYCLVLPNGLRSDTATQEEWEAAVQEAFMAEHNCKMVDFVSNVIVSDYFTQSTPFGKAVAFYKHAQNKLFFKWLWEGKEGVIKDLGNNNAAPSSETIEKQLVTLQKMIEEDTTDLYDLLDISIYSKEENYKKAFKFAEDNVTDVILYEELPQTVSKFDILKDGYFLYYGEIEGYNPKDMFKAFTADYPALYSILDQYVKENLPVFKGIKAAKYHELLISYTELEEKGIADYSTTPTKEHLAKNYAAADNFDYMTYKRIKSSGYAVLQDFVPGIADTGEIQVQSDLRLAVNLEALEAIELMKNNMIEARENRLLPSVRYLFAFNTLIDIFADFFGYEDLLKVKVKEYDITSKMESYNDLIFLLYKTVFGNEEQKQHKRELVKTLFTPLYAENFKPTAQAIAQVKEEVEKLGFSKAGRDNLADYDYYITILLGETPPKKRRG